MNSPSKAGRFLPLCAFVCFAVLVGSPSPGPEEQEAVSIRVDAQSEGPPFPDVWIFFGFDEPNFTYAPNGKKLISELSRLSSSPVHIRTHNLLTSGDGTAALKWGSTNVYTEGANGAPVYDWNILDEIFDTYREAGIKPLVEIGFMPEALSVKPEPYRHSWPLGPLWTGWAYPPKDYSKWAELVRRFVLHLAERYGQNEAETWYWEAWNEPDIPYWRGTAEEYFKLYDFTADAVKQVLPRARMGGPDSTGPANPHAAEFLKNFLKHCEGGRNYATGKAGAPLDFIAFHAKGSPRIVDGHVQMGISRHLLDVSEGFQVVASFPELRHLPVILGESDPEGCAACSAEAHPENAYRNGPLYPTYVAEVQKRILELADRYTIDLAGVITWAFEFENQPYFAGFRSLATQGIDKPVLNVFRMMGMMQGRMLRVESSQSSSLDSVLSAGVRGSADVQAMATGQDREIDVIVWNYHDDDVRAPPAVVELIVRGVRGRNQRVLVRHYRADREWSNSFSLWREMGSPQKPSNEQYKRLEAAGQLQMMTSPRWLAYEGGQIKLNFTLPRESVSLIQLNW